MSLPRSPGLAWQTHHHCASILPAGSVLCIPAVCFVLCQNVCVLQFYIVDPAPSPDTLATTIRHRRAVSDLRATSFDSQGLPLLSSKPGARNKLYLDFNGHTTDDNSFWTPFSAAAFSLDSDRSKFNAAEQLVIEEVWQRVTEDFSPFQYDVTTVGGQPCACFACIVSVC